MVYTLFNILLEDIKFENVALGTFDGVHKGHVKIFREMSKSKGKSLVITFIFDNEKDRILTIDEKVTKINKEVGNFADILVIHLNKYNLSATKDEFIKFLNKLYIKNIFVGNDYRFGFKAQGSIEDLEEQFNVCVVDYLENDKGKVSSSVIREELKKGEIDKVNNDLGYNYFINGEVIKGKQIGTTINFPTANIVTNKLLPKNGVYKTQVEVQGVKYKSITNVGVNPTFGENYKRVETHILGTFSKDIYGEKIKVEFLEFIREEKKFSGIEELKEQIQKDINSVRGTGK